MLCEQCHERDVTVFVTLVDSPYAETINHEFCDSCYPAAEAERVKNYNSQPDNPPPADVEHITAAQYLEANARATCDGVDIPAFRHIQQELKRLPKTAQRLAFELQRWATQSLERGEDPGPKATLAAGWCSSIEAERLPEYVTWLEWTILRCFELRGHSTIPQADRDRFGLALVGTLTALEKVDPGRFTALLAALKRKYRDTQFDSPRRFLALVEKSVLRSALNAHNSRSSETSH